jgi:hypothetical protein
MLGEEIGQDLFTLQRSPYPSHASSPQLQGALGGYGAVPNRTGTVRARSERSVVGSGLRFSPGYLSTSLRQERPISSSLPVVTPTLGLPSLVTGILGQAQV